MNDPVVRVTDLKKYYPIRTGPFGKSKGTVRAVDGISFSINRGSTLGLVGESGCGKSTTGRMILQLGGEKTAGQVLINGQDIYALSKRQLRRLRPKMQIVFQDPYSSLSPRLPVGELIGEGVREHRLVAKEAYEDYISSIMHRCGLDPGYKNRYPHEFSGGQRQRIGIARALALKPDFVVCDEPVSALDVSVQAQIVNLLQDLQEQLGLTYLFISHDLSVVEHICDSVAVMYLGNIVEQAATEELYQNPLHPYTRTLLSAIPVADPDEPARLVIPEGTIPSATAPSGCPFHPRCPHRMDICPKVKPPLQEVAPGHLCACHLYPQEINL